MPNNRISGQPAQSKSSSVNLKSLAYELGVRNIRLRNWLRYHHYERKRGAWWFSEEEAQQIATKFRASHAAWAANRRAKGGER